MCDLEKSLHSKYMATCKILDIVHGKQYVRKIRLLGIVRVLGAHCENVEAVVSIFTYNIVNMKSTDTTYERDG